MMNKKKIKDKISDYWKLIKSLQTFLLVITGVAGFVSTKCLWFNFSSTISVFGSLFLAVSGTTVLNMFKDRDLDALMDRTCRRPLPDGRIKPQNALILGIILTTAGVSWALSMDLLFGVIVFAGFFFDFVVYTLWLKRKTEWAIIWGGISGCMPVLAGRAFGEGKIEIVGILMAIAVLFWIPTHILTFTIRRSEDYKRANIPTFPARYGEKVTLLIIAFSSIIAIIAMIAASYLIGLQIGLFRLMVMISLALFALTVSCIVKPSGKNSFWLFKFASVYMLVAMLIFASNSYF
jgi:protoheme IX farnesyltransferase